MGNFENPSKGRQLEKEKAARVFNDAAEYIRNEVRLSNIFNNRTKAAILEILDAGYNEFEQEVLDKSTRYNGEPMETKIKFFFADRVARAFGDVDDGQKENVFQFMKQIVIPGDTET